MEEVLRESKSFFNLPLDEKMSLLRRDLLGYTPLHAEKLDPSLTSSTGDLAFFCIYGFFSCWLHLKTLFLSFFFLGDSKESFYFGSLEGALAQRYPNQWPPEGKYIYFLLPVSLFSFKRFLSYPSRVMCLCVKDLLPSWRQAMECYYKNVL